MSLHITITTIAALIVVIIATITDIKTTKIFNWLTLPSALIGLILRPVQYALMATDNQAWAGVAGFIDAFIGLWVGMLTLGIFKMTIMRQFGGGDIKLMGAIGALVGPAMVFSTFLYYCFCYGIYTCTIMSLAFPWKQAAVAYAAKDTSVLNMEKFNQVRKAPLPVAPFIAAGFVLAVLLQDPTMALFGVGGTNNQQGQSATQQAQPKK